MFKLRYSINYFLGCNNDNNNSTLVTMVSWNISRNTYYHIPWNLCICWVYCNFFWKMDLKHMEQHRSFFPDIKIPWYNRLIIVRNIYRLFKKKPIQKFDKLRIPMCKQPFPELKFEDLISVQPMTAPTGQIFKFNYTTPTKWDKFKRWIWR